jgi:AmmeMemoRadiSam system protein B
MADANIQTMPQQPIRAAAVAGSWYPGNAGVLRREVQRYLDRAASEMPVQAGLREVRAVIVPHAGLMYSGPVGAFAYATLAGRRYDAIVLVGPSHFVAFEGAAIVSHGAFEQPAGLVAIAEEPARRLVQASAIIREMPAAHAREHSLEMQLPFLAHVLPGTPIVPLVMGQQSRETIVELARALAQVFRDASVLLVASSDLSHYHDARTAEDLDRKVLQFIERYDSHGLLDALRRSPEHACGGGPIVSVMLAAWDLGARDARVLHYADSGDVSGDKSAVVGYVAAALGTANHQADEH